jgi:hypothetical protein
LFKLTNIPKDRKITYGKIVCDNKPHKKEKERVRLTVGGYILDYSGDVTTSTADITTFKILINGTLSTKDATMMMIAIDNYYPGTPLPWFEYMKMLLSRFPEEIVHKYKLWLHKTRPISFTLIVDNFAVKYVGKQHAEHLRNALLRTYELTTDWMATVYSGMTLK